MTKRGKAAKGGKTDRKKVAAPAPRPARKPPRPATQVAALCVDDARERVLLITSRGTGRWIVPKGWPIRKKSLAGTALQEAWEEAGVEGQPGKKELGRYYYDKLRDHGFAIPVEVRLFAIAVERLRDDFPEQGQRHREWFTPAEAAERVGEDGLKALILALPRHLAAGLVPGGKAPG